MHGFDDAEGLATHDLIVPDVQHGMYNTMVGGQFVAHPGGVLSCTVSVVARGDPVTKGPSDFRVTPEQYYMRVDPSRCGRW